MAAAGGRELFINTGPNAAYPAPSSAYAKAGFTVIERPQPSAGWYERKMRDDVRRARFGLALLAIPNLITALWALVIPNSWYEDFPGRGLGWVSAFGAYNEHFIQDIGGAYLGFGALLLYAAVRPTRSLVRGATIGYLLFAGPHLAIHLFVRENLSTAGYLGTIAPLIVSVALAAWVAWRASSLEDSVQRASGV